MTNWCSLRGHQCGYGASLDPDTPPQFLVTWKHQEISVKNRSRQEREWTAGSIELFIALAEECYNNRRIMHDVLSDNNGPFVDAAGNPIGEAA